MKTDEEIKNDVRNIEKDTLVEAFNLLRKYNSSNDEYLAEAVASACDVDIEEMMSDTKHLTNSHARWLYWYAYRYSTNASYYDIAKRGEKYRLFTESCVGICVSKMAMMIDNEPIWKKRWTIVKHVIKTISSVSMTQIPLFQEQTVVKLSVLKPENVDIKVELKTE